MRRQKLSLECCHWNCHVNSGFRAVDSGFRAVDSGFRAVGSGFHAVDSRFFVNDTWIPDSMSCIPDSNPRIPVSTGKNFPDSGIPILLHEAIDFRTSHPAIPHLTKPHTRTRKHLTRTVINTPSNMNRPRQTRERTDKGTRSSGTTLHSVNVITNIGRRFLSLVNKCFPIDHKPRKIFNRNTIKISYSCMNNTEQIIDNHNKRTLKSHAISNTTVNDQSKKCNCRQKHSCPLRANCLQTSIIYKAIRNILCSLS